MQIPNNLKPIVELIIAKGGRPFIVGGAVRDALMGEVPKDFDIEVFNMNLGDIEQILRPFGHVSLVGQAFGVLNLRMDGEAFDFSVPRRDNNLGVGHKDVRVECDPSLNIREAASRRDFTCNAIAFDLVDNTIVDPFNGVKDIQAKILRPTSESFKEDALRVLRAMQFAARFDFNGTDDLCLRSRGMIEGFASLPKERLWEEWKKWAVKGKFPSSGLIQLERCGWMKLFPEIDNLFGIKQDPIWHPEGGALWHTMLVCDAAAEIADREGLGEFDRCVLMFAALCHDMGKVGCTAFIDGRWRSPGHAQEGVPLADSFLKSIGCPNDIRENVLPLVAEHIAHCNIEVNKRNLRRLALRLGVANIEQLLRVIEADMSGRPPLPKGLPAECVAIREMAKDLSISKAGPEAILMGRHLISAGIKPGPEMGLMLKDAFEAQLNGEFDNVDNAIVWIKGHYEAVAS